MSGSGAAARAFAVVVCAAFVAACGDASDAARAYRDGRFKDAQAAFARAVESSGQDASPQLLWNAALAALRAGDAARAEALSKRAAERADAATAPYCDFLVGNAVFARAEIAAAQAATPEAEPFAFDYAIGPAKSARDAWRRAATSRDDWPEARRNVERASLLIADLTRKKADADRNRQRNRPPGAKPRPRPTAPKPTQADAPPAPPLERPNVGRAEPGKSTAADVQTQELTSAQLSRILEQLDAKEREKLELRRARRKADEVKVEKDW